MVTVDIRLWQYVPHSGHTPKLPAEISKWVGKRGAAVANMAYSRQAGVESAVPPRRMLSQFSALYRNQPPNAKGARSHSNRYNCISGGPAVLSPKNTIAFVLAILFAVAFVSGQDTKKSYVFKGVVTDVDASAKKLVVANEYPRLDGRDDDEL